LSRTRKRKPAFVPDRRKGNGNNSRVKKKLLENKKKKEG